jgi:predicted outer membrane repeat protein
MFWRKAFHILVISILLVGGFSMPSAAEESKALTKTVLANPTAPTIIYVDLDAPGPTYDGSSWADAYLTVQDALAVASSGMQIWVAEGVYYPDEGAGQINDDITSTFTLIDGVELYGGFMGIEDSLDERDWDTHVTVLSGDIDHETNPDITDPHGVVSDTTFIAGSNAYNVVYCEEVSDTTVIDGFTITAGRAFGDFPDSLGGGMYNLNSDPMLTNVTFSSNSALNFGGGMYNDNSNPTLSNLIFFGNSANSGGGMYNYENSDPTLTNVTFSSNSVSWRGGGMWNFNSRPTLTNVSFSNNRAGSGGGMYNYGSSPALTNVTISGNSASSGGGMYNYENSDPTLTNVILWGNTADSSGNQIYNDTGTSNISYSDIQGSGGSGSGWDSSLGTDGGGNIDADPLFVDAPNGDLHLSFGSPVIDSGDDSVCPAKDLDGLPRPQGAGCDMGAYEYNVIFVDKDATGPTHDGTSWTNAYLTVQDALAVASSGMQIWVAEGVYYPDEGAGQTHDDVTSTFTLTDGVELYGGFMGTEGSLDERDWDTHITVLSGDIDHETYPDTTDSNGVVTDTANIAGTNAIHVVYSVDTTVLPVLNGLFITAGYAEGSGSEDYGGGMYNASSSPALTNVTFSGNSAQHGGGMFNNDSDPTLINVTFSNNSAGDDGGGMHNKFYSNPTLTNVTFYANGANGEEGIGGGMYNTDYSNPTLTDVTFSGNTAALDGGGMYNNYSCPLLTKATFYGNSAGGSGGGMYTLAEDANNCITLINVTFSNNSAGNDGGGMVNGMCGFTLINVSFSGNSAVDAGGGMRNSQNSSSTLINVVFWGNTAGSSGNQIYNDEVNPSISFSDIQDSGGSGAGWDSSLGTDGGGNIDADPLFVDALNDDLHLSAGSPAINTGDDSVCPFTDLDGVTRPQGSGCDMGAYEYNVIFVDKDATGPTHNGISWANAYLTVQDGLAAASSGAQIWVAEGVYYPDEGIGQTNDDRTSTFTLTDGVALYGGFNGTEVSLDESDWEAQITVLSGDIDHETNPDTTDINGVVVDTNLIAGNNAYHVTYSSGVTETTIIDGFTITAGKDYGGSSCANGCGGGMYNENGSPTLRNLIFSGNSAYQLGGGMYNYGSSPTLTNVTFSNNYSGEYGGGIYNGNSSNPTLTDVIFSDNKAHLKGGGIFNTESSNSVLTNVTFSGNSTDDWGGGMFNAGSNPTLTNVTFSGNSAENGGGGMVNRYNSNPKLTNVTFSNNVAENSGGGMSNNGSSPTMTNVTFSGNSADYGGGMSNFDSSDPTLNNVILWGNTASYEGNQIYNDTFNPSNPIISFSDIQGSGGSGVGWNTSLGTDGGGNIDADPLFVDAPNDDLHLRFGSPAIDSGDGSVCPATDLDGVPRPQGAGCEMGAYEFNVIFVDKDAPGPAHDGSSWATAYLTVQDALAVASSGNQIWVAEGVYYPDEGAGQTNDDRYSTFTLIDGVALYGGFIGTEGSIGERNWENNITVLSGDIDHETNPDVIDPNGVVTDFSFIMGNNAYNVVYSEEVSDTTMFDGFTITAGYADESDQWDHRRGGGMYNDHPSTPMISNVSFSGNWADEAGGGMFNNYSDPTLTNVIFSNNAADHYGGGIANKDSSPTLSNVTFSSNSVWADGGGMFNYQNSNPTLINVTISNNSASSGGGMANSDSSPTLINVILWGNIVDSDGDQIYNDPGNPSISFSDIQGSGGSGAGWDSSLGTDGGGNIDADPLFVDALNDDLHLSAGSPAIDTGDDSVCPATDLDGVTRPQGASCDMGGYEYTVTTVIFVDKDAPGPTYDGSSWATAYPKVQDGLAWASSGAQIWVAEGVYYPDEGAGQTNDDRTSTFTLKDGVELYGGFTGTEGSLDERDWDTHITVLSGDIDHETNPDKTDTNGVVIDTVNIIGSNAYHVISNQGVTDAAILDGFSITAGQANNYPDDDGGGMYNDSSSPTLTNVTFSGNSAEGDGGGMYNDSSSPTLTNVTFSGNSAEGDGGGMYNDNSNPTLTNVTFSDNSVPGTIGGGSGGGMYNQQSSPILNDVTFSNNSAQYGGGMWNYNYSNPVLTDVTFSGNSASVGGGMWNDSDVTLINVTFSANSVTANGGGMHNYGDSTLTNVTFSENSADGYGGGMDNFGDLMLTNVTFFGNSADGDGGGMHNWTCNPTLVNVTFSNNSASFSGGGMFNGEDSSPTLNNVILWGNTAVYNGDQISNNISNPSIRYSDIQGSGGSGVGWDSSLGTDGGGNIDADPLFVDAPNGDLHLSAGSPAIDTGDNSVCPATDLDGVTRPQGAGCDMGAYEHIPTNLQPIAVDDSDAGFITDEDTPFTTASVLTNDDDPDGDELTVQSIDTSGTQGQVIDNGDGTFDYDPDGQFEDLNAGQQAADSFEYTITDGNGGTDSATVTITIHGLNAPPTAVDDSGAGFTTDEDTPFRTANVLDNDSDPEEDFIAVRSMDTTGTIGQVINHCDGTFDYDPDGQFEDLKAGQQATDSFAYTIDDEYGGTDIATVTITIYGLNDPPTAVHDSGAGFITDEDTPFTTANVLTNDHDPEDDALNVQGIDTRSTKGLVVDKGNGTFIYDPNGQFEDLDTGEQTTDRFDYTVSDGNGGTDTATVIISITGINDAPDAVDDAGYGFVTDKATSLTTASVLSNDSDPESHPLVVKSIHTSGTKGIVTDNGDGTFDYDPAGQFDHLKHGEWATDSFEYTISDRHGGMGSATVTITITGFNDPPVAEDDLGTGFMTDEDTPFTTANVLPNDADPNGDTLTVQSIDTSGTKGQVIDNGDGTFNYDPDGQFEELKTGQQATDSFEYIVSDGNWGTDRAKVTIKIHGVNDSPTAIDDSGLGFTTNEDTPFTTANVLANDSDPENDTKVVQSIDTSGTRGQVTDNGDGTFDYDPVGQFEDLEAGQQDKDTFTYTISDGNGGTDTATVTITITGIDNGCQIYLPVVTGK